MTAVSEVVVTGRLIRGEQNLASRVPAKIRGGIGITFPFRRGTIVTGELLRLLTDDRAIEFVVNSEIPESPGGEATYDGRILNDHPTEHGGSIPGFKG